MFRSHGYLPSGTLICADGEELDLRRLPRFLRTLLVADGTVTKSLEAYFWEAVSIVPVAQENILLERSLPELDAASGDTVLRREVILKGEHSSTQYAFARSFLRLDTINSTLRSALEKGVIGIGELLREQGIETYREIVSIQYYEHAPKDDLSLSCLSFPAVGRSYRIRVSGMAAFLVTEYFPISVYATPPDR